MIFFADGLQDMPLNPKSHPTLTMSGSRTCWLHQEYPNNCKAWLFGRIGCNNSKQKQTRRNEQSPCKLQYLSAKHKTVDKHSSKPKSVGGYYWTCPRWNSSVGPLVQNDCHAIPNSAVASSIAPWGEHKRVTQKHFMKHDDSDLPGENSYT